MTVHHDSPDRYDVPGDDDPVRCPECGRPFRCDRLVTLHRGQEHAEHLRESERAAYQAAYAAETEQLRLFRLKALLGLIVLYFGLLMTYAIV